jgi:hypothetical protein
MVITTRVFIGGNYFSIVVVSLVWLQSGNLCTETVNSVRGNEKAVLDLTLPKMAIASTVELTCLYDERR